MWTWNKAQFLHYQHVYRCNILIHHHFSVHIRSVHELPIYMCPCVAQHIILACTAQPRAYRNGESVHIKMRRVLQYRVSKNVTPMYHVETPPPHPHTLSLAPLTLYGHVTGFLYKNFFRIFLKNLSVTSSYKERGANVHGGGRLVCILQW